MYRAEFSKIIKEDIDKANNYEEIFNEFPILFLDNYSLFEGQFSGA